MKKILASLFTLTLSVNQVLADKPSTHGMLLFGKQTAYASHLPMFHKPHDYQAIFQLELKKDAASPDTLVKYKSALVTSTEIFTLVPELMDLSEVIVKKKTSFKAEIFKGHFEKGGTSLGSVIVNVAKVIEGKKIKPEDGPSTDFLLFGKDGEYFGAHVIKGQPTYDAIYSVEKPNLVKVMQTRRGPMTHSEPVQDSKLPVIVHGTDPQKEVSPNAGEQIGVEYDGIYGSFITKVVKPIYVEVEELNY